MATESNCNADTLANELALSLQGDLITVPAVDLTGDEFSFDVTDQTGNPLFDAPTDISLDDLTDTTLDGSGVFDVMMRAVDTHIDREFEADRFTADKYAEVYTELLLGVMNNATQFVLTKDQTRFEAIRAQMEARKSQIMATSALVELETAKYQTAQMYYDMQKSGAGYALTKMQIANADAEHCMIKASTDKERFTVDKILPVTLAQEVHKLKCLLPAQTRFAEEQVESQRAQTLDTRSNGLTPIAGILGRQKAISILEAETRQYALDNSLPAQLALINEQREGERAKTLDTRTDGVTRVAGSVGKQKDLYTQQIDSFQKDAKHKAAKMYLDGWITQKTLDEGLLAPTELQNDTIDTVLASLRTENGLV